MTLRSIVAGSLSLAFALAVACGKTADTAAPGESADAGLADAAQADGDAGPTSGTPDAGSVPDAGTADAGETWDGGSDPCAQFTSAPGRNLVVRYGNQAIEFAGGAFDADYNEDLVFNEQYWYFIFKSTDGRYGLELRLSPFDETCPRPVALPGAADAPLLIFYARENFEELAASRHPGSSGTLVVTSHVNTPSHKEIEFRCDDCVLGPVPGGPGTSVSVGGSAHDRL